MPFLLLVSFIWALSFGLIKGRLTGLDPTAVATVRIALAALVFLPFFRPGKVPRTAALWLATIGAIQFGAMYLLYLRAFAHLHAFEVALFTIFTPLYIALLDAALDNRFRPHHAAAAVLSVAGAAVVVGTGAMTPNIVAGFLLVQASNLCFAAGQIAYKRTREQAQDVTNRELFAWLYLGALATTAAVSVFATDWTAFRPTAPQWGVLAYLGVLASGLCFFWWNLGATRVNAGTLAAFNNAKIPLAVACSLLIFGEKADVGRLLISGVLLGAAVWVAERKWPGAAGESA